MIFLIFCVLCIPIIQLIGGWCMRYHTPKKINSWIGYRTTNAMKNADTWKLANQYCGKLWLMIGTVSLILSAIIGFSCLFFSKKIAAILILRMISVQTLVLLLTIPFVEAKLKRENTSHDKN